MESIIDLVTFEGTSVNELEVAFVENVEFVVDAVNSYVRK